MNEFEQKLKRQPLRKIPGGWRTEILAAVDSQARRGEVRKISFLSTINHQLSNLFWPHPKAWAALAVIWIFIFAVNFSMRDNSPRIGEKSAPLSPEVIVELKKEQLLYAELIGPRETPDADRQKIFSPKPRSERVEILMT